MYLTSPALAAPPGIRHGFFTRRGGVSTGIYAELNCGGRGSAEPATVVDENRARVARELQIDPPNLLSVYQVHGPVVVTVDTPWTPDDRPKGDAMVTRVPGLGLGILTADCVPVLFADAEHGVIGAAHSGWKGSFAGVLQETVAAMERLGAKRSSILAAIGPAIAQASYEVDAAFRDRFLAADAAYTRYFTAIRESGHSHFDLPRFAFDILGKLNVRKVDRLENDTYAEEERFYSFRRATHRGEPDYGRQLSVITIMPQHAVT